MKVYLKTAVKKMVNRKAKELKYYLINIIHKTHNDKTWLREGEVIEITYKNITVSFTWEMISAVNCKTNKYIDLISIKNVDEVVDFFEEEGITMPVCPLWNMGNCPVCDDEWINMGITYAEGKKMNKECCESHRNLTIKELNGGK